MAASLFILNGDSDVDVFIEEKKKTPTENSGAEKERKKRKQFTPKHQTGFSENCEIF